MKQGRSQLFACLALLVAFATAGGSASASVHEHGGYSYVSHSLTLAKKKTARHTLDCPRGTHVYGGGISAKAAFKKLHQTQSYPVDTKDSNTDPDDAWGVLVQNSGKKKLKARMFAICGKTNPAYVRTHENLGPGSNTNEIDNHCTTHVVGGGVQGSKGVVFEDGGPLNASTWYAYANNSASTSGHVNEWAICAPLPTLYPETSTQNPPMTAFSLRVSCPDGYSALAGGSSTTGDVNTTTSVPFGTYQGWLLRGDFTGNFQGTADALVACAADQN